jgi:CelD/BcsL family acetyltransferase involved in cellulose biosynthesis
MRQQDIQANLCEVESELLTTRDRWAEVQPEVEQLLERTGAPPSARRETIDPWFRHHPYATPWGVVVRSNGEIVASAMLAHTVRHGMNRFTTPYVGVASWLPAQDAATAHLLAGALRDALEAFGKPWILHLAGLPSEDATVDALRAELSLTSAELGQPMARLCFAPGQPLGTYLSRNTRSAVAKAVNRIKRAGLKYELRWTHDPGEIDANTADLIDVHRRRSHQMFGASPLDDAATRDMFADIVHAHAHANRIRLLTLRLDRSLAAFALCEEAAGILWVGTNRAAPEWLAFSPGTIVNAEVVRAAHADPEIHTVDWGGVVQRYKLSGEVTLVRFQTLWAWSSHRVQLFTRCTGSFRRLTHGVKAVLRRAGEATISRY